MHNRTPIQAAIAATIAIHLPTQANEYDSELEPMIVTATRTAETADESLGSVSVITRNEIEQRQAESATTLLSRVQGVEITRSGGRGKTASLHMRGTESEHVIVLIDGIRVGSATTGAAAIEDLSLDSIERIEVVRGPRSSLYGSDAIGGVIQLFTRDDAAAHASVGTGSNNSARARAGSTYVEGDGRFSVNVSHETTEGFDAHEDGNPDRDGYRNTSFNVRASDEPTAYTDLSAYLSVSTGENEYDSPFDPPATEHRDEFVRGSAGVNFDWDVTRVWDTHIRFGTHTDDSQNYLNDAPQDRFRTRRQELAWQNDWTVGSDSLVTAGIDGATVEVQSNNIDYSETERDIFGTFLQVQRYGKRWDWQASARHDDYSDFGNHNTGNVALGYAFSEETRLFSSLGSAFKAPTFNDLFYDDGIFSGNPDLKPEESVSAELGLQGVRRALDWEVTAYRTEVENLIRFDETQPENVAEATIQGIEIGLAGDWRKWSAEVALSYKDPVDDESGNQLPRRAKESADLTLTHQRGNWSVATDLQYRGQRYDDAANEVELDPFTVVDLRGSWHFAREWTAALKIANATDEEYALVDSYNTGGRSAFVELRWRPGVD